MNKDKTQVVWIGKKKHCKDRISVMEGNFQTISNFKLLGIYFSTKLNDCVKINYSEKIPEIKDIINRWNKRYLTPLGKITVIKTFILPKLSHIFQSL